MSKCALRGYYCSILLIFAAATTSCTKAPHSAVIIIDSNDRIITLWDTGEEKRCLTFPAAAIQTREDGKASPVLFCGEGAKQTIFINYLGTDNPEATNENLAKVVRIFPVRIYGKGQARPDAGLNLTEWRCTKEKDGSIDCE